MDHRDHIGSMSIRCGLQSLYGVLACDWQLGLAEFHAASFGCREGCFGPGGNKGTLLFSKGRKRVEEQRSVDGGLFGEDALKDLTPYPGAGQHGLVDFGLHDPG